MLRIKRIVIVGFLVASLTIGLAPILGAGADPGDETVIWNTNTDPNPFSDHTRCEVIFAKDKYWLFFDWIPEGEEYPDIYMMSSRDAVDWSSPEVVVDGPEIEQSPRVLFYHNHFHLTYLMGNVLYTRTSRNGRNFGAARELYAPPTGGGLSYYEIVRKKDWFFLAYEDLHTADILVARSRNLHTWDTPVVAASTEPTDYTPDICVAKGRIWLVWNYNGPNGHSHPWVTSSKDGVTWTDGTPIPTNNPTDDVWGPFSLIYDKGQFIYVSRVETGEGPHHWRIYVSTSRDGISWTPFEPVTDPSLEGEYNEKGPTVFPIRGRGSTYDYSVIFKKHWFSGPYQICQSLVNL